MLPDLPFFGSDAVSKAGAACPERFERLTESLRGALDLDSLALPGKGTQGSGYVEGD